MSNVKDPNAEHNPAGPNPGEPRSGTVHSQKPAPADRPAEAHTENDQFAENVLACVEDLNAVLPRLATRYEDLVIVAALSEHVGGALRIFMQAGACTPEQARRLLAHIEDMAFSPQFEEQPS